MKMKKYLLAICAISAFVFSACSSDKEEPPTPPVDPVEKISFKATGGKASHDPDLTQVDYDRFVMRLSNMKFDDKDEPVGPGSLMSFDLYTPLTSDTRAIVAGDYEYSATVSEKFTIAQSDYSYFQTIDHDGKSTRRSFESGKITVKVSGDTYTITGSITLADKAVVDLEFSGELEFEEELPPPPPTLAIAAHAERDWELWKINRQRAYYEVAFTTANEERGSIGSFKIVLLCNANQESTIAAGEYETSDNYNQGNVIVADHSKIGFKGSNPDFDDTLPISVALMTVDVTEDVYEIHIEAYTKAGDRYEFEYSGPVTYTERPYEDYQLFINAELAGFDNEFSYVWVEGEAPGLIRMTEEGKVESSDVVVVHTIEGSIDGNKASFFNYLTEGYYLAYFPSNAAGASAGEEKISLNLETTQTQDGQNADHYFDRMVYFADKASFLHYDVRESDITLHPLWAMAEIEVGLKTDYELGTVNLLGITMMSEEAIFPVVFDYSFDPATLETTVAPSTQTTNYTNSITLQVEGEPELSATEAYTAYMLVPPVASNSPVTFMVETSMGTIPVTGTSVKFDSGKAYTINAVRQLDFDDALAPAIVGSKEDWNEYVTDANNGGLKNIMYLTTDLTFEPGDVFPTRAMTFRKQDEDITLTFNIGETDPYKQHRESKYRFVNETQRKSLTIPADLTLNGVNIKAVGAGDLYTQSLTLSGGAGISAEQRVHVEGSLMVQNGETTLSAERISCDRLVNNGTLQTNCKLFYGNASGSTVGVVNGGEAISRDGLQMENSGFETWTKSSNVYHIGSSSTPKNNWWDSGNPGTGTSMGGSTSTTTPETTHVVSGSSAARLSSQKITPWIVGDKFAAGNLYVGDFIETKISKGGVDMDFGKQNPYSHVPVALTGYLDYSSSNITTWYDANKTSHLVGTKDKFDGYIAIGTKKKRVETYTDTSYFDLATDTDILAYGHFTSDETTGGYVPFKLYINLKDGAVIPDTYFIFVTFSSSAAGRFFTGSVDSVLYLDDLQLEF